jgi:hypothetical protein
MSLFHRMSEFAENHLDLLLASIRSACHLLYQRLNQTQGLLQRSLDQRDLLGLGHYRSGASPWRPRTLHRSTGQWNHTANSHLIDEHEKLAAAILDRLRIRDREALTRFYVQQQTPEQICRDLNLTRKEFFQIKPHAKERFRKTCAALQVAAPSTTAEVLSDDLAELEA